MLSYPHIDPVAIHIGPIAVRWYGLMYVLGILGGFSLVHTRLKLQFKLNSDQISSLALAICLGIIIGGRLGYIVLYDFAYYMARPAELLAYWHGGMSYHGGALGCVAGLIWFARQHRAPLLPLLDLLGLASTIGIFFGRIGNFINGELWGRITGVPWAMIFPGAGNLPRHPSQLYEAGLEGVVLFILLVVLWKRFSLKPGQLFAVYLMGYGTFRFGLEFCREPDSQIGLFFQWMSLGQVLCALMILAGLVGFRLAGKRAAESPV